MTQDQKGQHTPGPLTVRRRNFDLGRFIADKDGEAICNVRSNSSPHGMKRERDGTHGQNARLLAAAYTSYDKHCGQRAVECAEADLLGEALKALRDLTEIADGDWRGVRSVTPTEAAGVINQARAVLAKASGKRHGA